MLFRKSLFVLNVAILLFSHPSMAGLKEVYLLRVKSNDFLRTKVFDSAAFYLSKVVEDRVLANATDYMNLSCCCLHLKDTSGFKQYMIYSIEVGGADSSIIPLYCRSLDSVAHVYLGGFLDTALPKYRAMFLKKVDPEIAREMEEIRFLDQLCRNVFDKSYPFDTSSSNFKCLRVIGHYSDSVNYDRVVNLIKHNRYPDFHNFGINSANYDPILMHISDIGEEQWNFIYDFLKKQLRRGAIMQNEVVAIATRHFRSKKCTYYGTKKWGLYVPCDCEHVDEIREDIGLDSLKQEYTRLGQELPECYLD